jgi:Protein of unknown function (DUF3500)
MIYRFLPWCVWVTATLAQAEVSTDMADKAKAYVALLTPEQKAKGVFPFDSPERENWAFIPQARKGLPLKEMTAEERRAGIALLEAGLSDKGALKAETIMSLEAVLAAIENDPVKRDPTNYFVSIFGVPGNPKGWSWRFEGHHLSINLTLAEGKFAATPSFMGTNPGEVRDGPKKGTRVLAAEEDLARALATTLAETGKAVVFTDKLPGEILTSAERHVKQLETVGVDYTALSDTQKEVLMKIVNEYLGRYRSTIVETELKQIKDAGLENIHFGWAGGLKRGEAYYYRIQGPTFLIEAANSQNNANHQHTVWRDFDGDFGRDFLGEHYQDATH